MQNRSVIGILVLIVVIIGVVFFLNAPDRRSGGEKVGDAIDQASQGDLGDAARELGDRTPADRVGDAIKDAGDNVRQ